MESERVKHQPPEIVRALAQVVNVLSITGHGEMIGVLFGGLRTYLGNERAGCLWDAVVCCVNDDWNDADVEEPTNGE